MMNNDELLKELNRLKAENEALKENILINTTIDSSPKSLEEYFSMKYLETFRRVRKIRLDNVQKEINSLLEKKTNLEYEITHANDLIKENEVIQNKVIELQNKYDKNTSIIENKAEWIKEQKEVLKKKQLSLKTSTLGYYEVITNLLDPMEDSVTILQNIDFVCKQLFSTLYDSNIECNQLNISIMQEELHYEALMESLKEENLNINNELDDLTKKLKNINVDELEDYLSSINDEINIRKRLLKELDETYIVLKDKDIKSLIDKINYLKVIGKPSDVIASEVTTYLGSLEENLKSTDTIKNTIAMKELELKSLLDQKKELDKTLEVYNEKKKALAFMEDSYNKASVNIDMLVDYIDNATLAVNENKFYKETVMQYEEYNRSLKEVKELHNEKDKEYQVLLDKKLDMNDASIQELQPILTELTNLQKEKNNLSSEITRITDSKTRLEKSPATLKILCVVKEKELAESSLASLYEDLRNLFEKIEKTKNVVKSLENELKGYDSLLLRIEEIQDEINN